jgi:myo-inositol-1(or 4)-monophosphatase
MKETVHKTLHEAGKILMKYYGNISGYSVKESQSSIVTKADIEAEKKIIEIILGKFPNHNTVGEETGFQNRNSEYTWIIDPLDGTSNFAVGIPWFGVIICVLKNAVPVMAGCYMPVSKELYFAEIGNGSTLNDKKISVTKETTLKNILAAYSLDFSDKPKKTEHEARIILSLVKNVRNIRSTNCVIEFCYIADGKLGACINQNTKIWDIAGPALIIEEAGGKVTDIFGKSIDFNINNTNFSRNFTILGSNNILHQNLIKLIKSSENS